MGLLCLRLSLSSDTFTELNHIQVSHGFYFPHSGLIEDLMYIRPCEHCQLGPGDNLEHYWGGSILNFKNRFFYPIYHPTLTLYNYTE